MSKTSIPSLLKKLPHQPGVYKFKDSEGKILYVGKAKDLKNRVTSYFRKEKNRPIRTQKLVEKTADLEWIVVGSDLEALFLETNLIKEWMPKYNVMMKDDKNFVYIKITKDEDFPRIKIVRKVEKDGARYFGPKTSAHQVKKTLLLLQKLFMYRSCDLGLEWKEGKVDVTRKTIAYPCLDFHIKRCAAPCIAKISPEEYMKSIEKIELFLEGKTKEIETSLQEEMKLHAENKNYEKAALVRDKWQAIQGLKGKILVTSPDHEDLDIFAFVFGEGKAYFNLFVVRDGKMINQEHFVVDAPGFETGDEPFAPEVMETFLFQYYEKAADIPKNVLIPMDLVERDFVEDWLSQQKGSRVSIAAPQKGKKRSLVDLAEKNALSFKKQDQARWAGSGIDDQEALEDLAVVLKLKKRPKRIEGFDISHLGGSNTVASMVVFENGQPKKTDYRTFKLKTLVEGEVDDFKSMEEILSRRLAYLKALPEGITLKKFTKSMKKELEEFLQESHRSFENLNDFLLLLQGKTLLGALSLVEGKGGSFLIQFLGIREAFRRQGFASSMLREAIKKKKIKRLYVACTEDLRPFYYGFGFEEVALFPKEFVQPVPLEGRVLYAFDTKKQFDASFNEKPDLILIDGGKGQLSAALKARDHLGLEIPMLGLAKQHEEVFVPGLSHSLLLPKSAKANLLLQRVRNEAHRFALTFQRKKRKEAFFE